MNATTSPPIAQSPPAHPLYPSSQVFLWLPGFPGNEVPYCSYNVRPSSEERAPWEWNHIRDERRDSNGAPFSPPFPVSPQSFICWHTDVSPAFPYHPVPIMRTLTGEEFCGLTRVTRELMGAKPIAEDDPALDLRNDNKAFVIAALTHMGLIAPSQFE